jgi:hypothetical protein
VVHEQAARPSKRQLGYWSAAGAAIGGLRLAAQHHGSPPIASVRTRPATHTGIAEIAGPRTAQLLDIAIGDAVQRINRLAFTAGDRPHHYLSILLSPAEAASYSTTPQTNWRSATRWE